MRHKFLRLFVHTLIVNEKHYLLNKDNLRQPIQVLLSKQQNTFSQFLFVSLKSILNFKHLPKKMNLVADVFLEITVTKYMVRQMSKKPCFRGHLERQQGKWVDTLLQSEWQHLYNIY